MQRYTMNIAASHRSTVCINVAFRRATSVTNTATHRHTKDFHMRQLLLATALMVGVWPHAASAQCPAAIPAPADATAVQCFTLNKPVNVRCATAVSSADCLTFNNQALGAGLLTPDGYNYLQSIRFCAITFALPGQSPKIFDFCPEGCFAADTAVLSSFRSDGRANYTRAES